MQWLTSTLFKASLVVTELSRHCSPHLQPTPAQPHVRLLALSPLQPLQPQQPPEARPNRRNGGVRVRARVVVVVVVMVMEGICQQSGRTDGS